MSEAPQSPATPSPNPGPGDAPPRSGRGWIWLVVVAVLAGGGYYGYEYWKAGQADPAAAAVPGAPGGDKSAAAKGDKGDKKAGKGSGRGATPVVAIPARTAPLNVYLTGLGTVTPLRTVTLRSRVDGQLMRVHFEEGQMVKQGQLLAEIDPRPFEVARLQVEGQLARDQALLANARLDLARYRTLLGQDSIAKQQVDAQEALVAQYEGVVKADQGQLENAKLQLAYSRIEAPISGRVGLRLVDPGNIVRGGDAAGLLVISEVTPISVAFTIPQDNLPALLLRMQEEEAVPVEAWDRDQTTRIATGRLTAVDNQVDTTTGTVKLKARFANRDERLFPNQFVNVRMRLDTLQDATVIPTAAVQRGSQGMFVYVVKEDQTVTARPVKLGPIDGGRVAVNEGVAPGEMVVVDGIDRLREGAAVQITKRPEFKPSVDGSSPSKKGQRKGGDGKGAPAKGGETKGGQAKGGDVAPAPPAGAAAPADRAGVAPDGKAGVGPAGKGAPADGEARRSRRAEEGTPASVGAEPRKGPREPRGDGQGAGTRPPRDPQAAGAEGAGERRGSRPPGAGGEEAKGPRRADRGGDESKSGRRPDKGGADDAKGARRADKGGDSAQARGGRAVISDQPGSESFRVQTEPYAVGGETARPAGKAAAGKPGTGEPRKGKPEARPEARPESAPAGGTAPAPAAAPAAAAE
jgi:multidrug efflux system membrane fusion protein